MHAYTHTHTHTSLTEPAHTYNAHTPSVFEVDRKTIVTGHKVFLFLIAHYLFVIKTWTPWK